METCGTCYGPIEPVIDEGGQVAACVLADCPDNHDAYRHVRLADVITCPEYADPRPAADAGE